MSVPSQPISYADASARVRTEAEALLRGQHASEELPLLEAQGRVLAAPIVADRDQPPFPRSTRDGFAGAAAGWTVGSLRVVGLLKAGEAWQGGSLEVGTCVEIMTGAPVPSGADCVVMVEHVERDARDGNHAVGLAASRTIQVGDNIVPAGAEALSGSVLLPEGTRLNAHGIAVASAVGAATLRVFRRPRVAILATGDELVDVGEWPEPHQIRNSNTYTLAAQVRAAGGEPVLFAPVRDSAEALRIAITDAAARCDLLLLSGGVSMGKYDLVEPALTALGGSFHFTGAKIQPGKPIVFGSLASNDSRESLPFFGLPGNPVSTIVCFSLFVAPLLAALAGERGYLPRFVQARLATPIAKKPGLTRFLPAMLHYDVNGASVEVLAWQGSGDLASTARANCFLVAHAEDTLKASHVNDLTAESMVTVLLA